MKIFFYMGRNAANKSGVSWKIWKIARSGRTVTTFWGRATLKDRKVTPAGTLQSKTLRFPSPDAALDYESQRIRSKLRKGYQRRTRWRST
jgi:predicted DNA-binding WGR domain protein